MKKITLEKVLASLADLQFQIEVPEEIRRKAERSLQTAWSRVLPEKDESQSRQREKETMGQENITWRRWPCTRGRRSIPTR